MIIKQNLLEYQSIKQITTAKKRVYETPIGTFPSVTTVLSAYFGREALDEWRAKVGDEEADYISSWAKFQGNVVHKLIENYLLGKSAEKVMPIYKSLFLKLKPFIDQNISTLYGIELPVFSNELKTAGTIDLIAEYRGRFKTITDFKTSRRVVDKDSDKLLKYKIQATTYALMIKEQYDIDIPFGVIAIVIPDEPQPQIFIYKIDEYRDKVKDIFEWAKLHF